ncbi:MAG: tetraacyldisaccharide 4'-kinase, partial [Xanthomonadales bacterium]|nr:tetraacyldisaccharide 4'-kinase [Xanthomonadales bacterium]
SERGPILLDAQADPARFGDEPCLIRQRTRASVAVGSDRVAAARLLLEQGVDVILSDDGLQHLRLQRDIEICVIDGQRRFGNGRLLPAGPLREPLTRLAKVNFRVVNGGDALTGEIAMRLVAADAWRLNDAQQARPLPSWSGQCVHAVAGIGHPPRFFASLRDAGMDVIEHGFADHHVYRASELAFNDGLSVLMTEKDAVKCADFDVAQAWVVPVQAQLPPGFFEQIVAKLRADKQVPTAPIGVA